MSLNIDTIRSLDASKTYYIANSTGEIKEAGVWQKFKCFFGIGDGRDRPAARNRCARRLFAGKRRPRNHAAVPSGARRRGAVRARHGS